MKSFRLDIVSPEELIFSGRAHKLFVTGVMGELEILGGHASLLTSLAPGPVWIVGDDDKEEGLVIFGGMLEVQPEITIVLADAVLRGRDIDEAAAKAAKRMAEHAIARKEKGLNYAKAHTDLSISLAQLRIVRKLQTLRK